MDRLHQDNRFGVQVKAIVINSKKKILLLKHKPNPQSRSTHEEWSLPTGHVEFEDNPYNAVWKGVFNQTGLEIDVINPTNVWTLNHNSYMHVLGITFHCKWDYKEFLEGQMELLGKKRLSKEEKDPFNLSDEFTDYAWVSAKEILDNNYPIWLKREIEKLSGKKPRQA